MNISNTMTSINGVILIMNLFLYFFVIRIAINNSKPSQNIEEILDILKRVHADIEQNDK